MNSIYKLVAVLGVVVCGQSWGATPGTKADCNSNMVLTELQPLKFGSFDATVGGSVTIDPTTGVRSATGVTLVSNDGQPGIIEVSLTPGYPASCTAYQVIITLPTSYTLTTAAGQTMTVNTLTTSPASNVGTLGAGNTPLYIYLGGTAVVAAGQAGGLYSGSYSVSMTFR